MPIGTPVPDECLIGRYTGEARFINKGDPELCAAWAGFARGVMGGLLNRLANSGITVGGRHLALPDGTRISVRYDGAQHIIKIDTQRVVKPEGNLCPIYLESGLAQFDELPLYLPEADPPVDDRHLMEPFKLERVASDDYDPPLTAKVKGQLGLYARPMPDSNAESVVLGRPLRDKYAKEDKKVQAEHETEINEEGKKLYELALTCGTMSPCMYSGKIQLYIESIWGAKHVSDRVIMVDPALSGILLPPYYIVDGIELQFTFLRGSPGLFVTDDYKHYFIILLRGGVVRITELEVKNYCSSILQQYLKKKGSTLSRASLSKIEAIILSTTKPGLQYTHEVGYSYVGKPFGDYGWHYNWQGDKADIILHESVYVNEDSPVIDHFTSRHYSFEFTFNSAWKKDKEEIPVNFSFQLAEETEYQLSMQDRLYWYDYSLRTTRINLEWTSWLGSDQDVKFYCYYDKDDTLQTINYWESHAVVAEGDPSAGEYCFAACMDVLEPAYCNWDKKQYKYGDRFRTGFYLSGQTPDDWVATRYADEIESSNSFIGTITYQESPHSTPCCTDECFTAGWWSSQGPAPCVGRFLTFGDPAVDMVSTGGTYQWISNIKYKTPEVIDSFLALSLFDCEAAYAGARTTRALYGWYRRTEGGNTFTFWTDMYSAGGYEGSTPEHCARYTSGPDFFMRNAYTIGGYGANALITWDHEKTVTVRLAVKNSSPITIHEKIDVPLGDSVTYWEERVFGNSREYPFIDWFLIFGERGVQDNELVFTGDDGDLDMAKTKYRDNSPHSGNYIGWA